MALKTEYFYYTSRNNQTGLADITANIHRNGVQVAASVGLTEVSSVNQPGVYVLTLLPATLSGYGGAGFYEVFINSASKPAPAVAAKWILANDDDDNYALGQTIDTKVTDVQTKVNDGTYGLAAIKTLIDSLQSTVNGIQNNTNFSAGVLPQSIKPGAGSNLYRIPINVYDNAGNMEDPDSLVVAVSITNEAGVDRTSYLSGYVSGPVNATRDAVGQYRIDYSIPSSAPNETLVFKFEYAENSLNKVHTRSSEVVLEAQSSGFALETTAQLILTDTSDMKPRVSDIQTKINDATYGLAALKILIDVIDTNVDDIEALLNNGTFGLAALNTAIGTRASQTSVNAIQADVDALQVDTADIKGVGFATGTDSLKQLSDRLYYGGRAV